MPSSVRVGSASRISLARGSHCAQHQTRHSSLTHSVARSPGRKRLVSPTARLPSSPGRVDPRPRTSVRLIAPVSSRFCSRVPRPTCECPRPLRSGHEEAFCPASPSLLSPRPLARSLRSFSCFVRHTRLFMLPASTHNMSASVLSLPGTLNATTLDYLLREAHDLYFPTPTAGFTVRIAVLLTIVARCVTSRTLAGEDAS